VPKQQKKVAKRAQPKRKQLTSAQEPLQPQVLAAQPQPSQPSVEQSAQFTPLLQYLLGLLITAGSVILVYVVSYELSFTLGILASVLFYVLIIAYFIGLAFAFRWRKYVAIGMLFGVFVVLFLIIWYVMGELVDPTW
jgi:hypothetical protein